MEPTALTHPELAVEEHRDLHQQFLLNMLRELLKQQRNLSDPNGILKTSAESLGRYLSADSAGFFEVARPVHNQGQTLSREAATLTFLPGWSGGPVPLLSGSMPATAFAPKWAAVAVEGQPEGIADVSTHELTRNSSLALTAAYSAILIPVVRNNTWVAGLYVLNADFRPWTEVEISLAAEVADLTWDAADGVQVRRKLHRAEARAQQILESIGDAVIVTDARSKITHINSVAEHLTGWPKSEATGLDLKQVFEIVNEGTREPAESPADKVRRLGITVGLANHTTLLSRDGREFNIDDSGAPVRGQDGQLSGVVIIFRDITEKRHRELEREKLLREVQLRYAELEATYNNAAIAMALIDPVEFRYLRVNTKLCEMLGQNQDTVVGSKVFEVAQEVSGLEEALRKVAAGQSVVGGVLEGELSTSPGVKRYWTMDYTPVFAPDGSVMAIAAASAEITRQKQAEAALIQTEKLAAVGRLASSIAHEINNPLASVTNLLYLVRLYELPPEVEGYIDTAERELRRVSAIANQTLRFHKQTTNPTQVNCTEMIDDVLAMHHARLINSRIRVEKRMRSKRPIICFEGEIRQVINNLIGNAIDAMPSGGGLLMIRTRDARCPITGKLGVVITVADTGSGMSKETVQKAFEPFFTTKGFSGTGLGLWISHEIAQRHEGKLRLRSSQNRRHHGTTVTLYLPSDAATR